MKPEQTNNWTEKEIRILRKHYSDTNNEDLTIFLDRTENAIMHKANRLGLRKSERFMCSEKSGRYQVKVSIKQRICNWLNTWYD